MSKQTEALKLALEALWDNRHYIVDHERPEYLQIYDEAIATVEKARAKLAEQPAQEPFGYFKAEPFGWTDCAETDEGAIALYTTPQAQPSREPLTLREIGAVCGNFSDEIVKVVRQTEAAHNIKENT